MPSPRIVLSTLPADVDVAASAAVGASRIRRLDIQGLRAVAVLMVVAFHSGLPVPGGFVGVDMFFVISGFVITSMLMREWAATGRIRFGRFYLRRFKRLTPALALMVSVTVAISVLVLSPLGTQQTTARTGLGAALLSANIVIARTTVGYFAAGAGTNPLLHTWSLSVEEQFYLVFPLVLVIGWVLRRRFRLLKAAPLLIVACVGTGSFAIAIVTSFGQAVPSVLRLLTGFYGPVTRAWEFAVGALLALAASQIPVLSKRTGSALALLGAGLLGASLWLITGDTPFPGIATLIPITGTLLLIQAGAASDNLVSRALTTRHMVTLGDLSYSWYLWHWPLIVFSTRLWPGNWFAPFIAVLVALAPAIASYRWVEQPIRGLTNLPRLRMARIVALTLIAPLGLSAGLGIAARVGFWSPEVQNIVAAAKQPHQGWKCMTNVTVSGVGGLLNPDTCDWEKGRTGPPIFLVGDSNAAQYGEAALGAAKVLNRPLVLTAAANCPLIDVFRSSASGSTPTTADKSCRKFYEDTLAYLVKQPRGLVIIAESSHYWYDELATYSKDLHTPSSAIPLNRTEALDGRADDLESGLRKTVLLLQQAGHQVVLVAPIYRFTDGSRILDPNACSLLSIFHDNCAASFSIALANPMESRARDGVQRVSSQTGSTFLDLSEYQCPKGICSLFNGETEIYQDAGHFSVLASEAVSPLFEQAIEDSGAPGRKATNGTQHNSGSRG